MKIARKFAAQLRIVPEEIGYRANNISHSTVSLCNHKSPGLTFSWNCSIGVAGAMKLHDIKKYSIEKLTARVDSNNLVVRL